MPGSAIGPSTATSAPAGGRGPRCTAQAQAPGVPLPGLAVVGVVEERLAPGDRQQGARAERVAGPRERLEQGPAALARLDPPHRQHRGPRAPAELGPRGGPVERARGESLTADPVRDHARGDAVVARDRLGPVGADAHAVVDVLDRGALALDEHRVAEVVNVVDGADHGGHDPLGAQGQQRSRRQAVLGVVHVGRPRGPQAVGQHVGVAQDAVAHRLARPALHRHQAGGDPRLAEEGGPVRRQRPQLHVVPAIAERLGQRQRVDDPSPGLGAST